MATAQAIAFKQERFRYRKLRQWLFPPRALAIDADGDVWLGDWRQGGFFEMDANSGKVRRWVGMGINPYGAVIDSRGILWAPNSCCSRGEMRSFNTNNFRVPADNSDWNSAASSNRWEANGNLVAFYVGLGVTEATMA